MSKTDCESDAERLYQDALRIMRASLLPDDPRIAVTHHFVPCSHRIDRTRLTSDNADLASHLYNLATLLQETGRLEEAEPLMREAIGILVWYRAFAGHEIAQLRSTAKSYQLLLKASGQDEPMIRDTIKELGVG
jgi:hypothetical protein